MTSLSHMFKSSLAIVSQRNSASALLFLHILICIFIGMALNYLTTSKYPLCPGVWAHRSIDLVGKHTITGNSRKKHGRDANSGNPILQFPRYN